jgi:hypothetical protein
MTAISQGRMTTCTVCLEYSHHSGFEVGSEINDI